MTRFSKSIMNKQKLNNKFNPWLLIMSCKPRKKFGSLIQYLAYELMMSFTFLRGV